MTVVTQAPARKTARLPQRQRLDESLGFLIAEAERASKRVLFARIADHGIRRGGWFVLRALWENEGMTQRELAQRLGLMETSVLEMVRALEGDGLVSRTRDPEDERRVMIALTGKGSALRDKAMHVPETIAQGRSPEGVEELREHVRQLVALLADQADRG